MKIFLDTIGCKLNQAEIEILARHFRMAGHAIVASAAEADLVVVNTCTVTAEAASDSRAAIRRANRSGAGKIVVTGCWATLEPDKAIAFPGVTCIVPNLQKDKLVSDLLGLPQEFFDLDPIARQPLPGSRQRTRAFIKIQDGCDNACTFCITTLARGTSRSRRQDEILKDIRAAIEGGVHEVVLTGVHLGSWGLELQPACCLSELVMEILDRTSLFRLRLSSLEPWDITPGFFNLWREPRLCRHLHIPLQSGSKSVLKRMVRKITPEAFAELVRSAREAIADLSITTDIIAGFPGETEEEFKETEKFIKDMQFAGGHVFSYSARPGTPAAKMKDQVHGNVINTRSAILRTILKESTESWQQKFIGRTMPVLWEATSTLTETGWQIEGLTNNYLRVRAFSREPRWNQIDQVKLITVKSNNLYGEIQE
jgi:threonylcarbamoyladenosine tRNA methylthiotransferase MtaB